MTKPLTKCQPHLWRELDGTPSIVVLDTENGSYYRASEADARIAELEAEREALRVECDGWARERDEAVAERDAANKRIVELSETWTDERGEVWSPPTAWAYAQACKALHATKAERDAARADAERYRQDAERLDYIERTFSGMTNRERYLPVTMGWGKPCMGRTLREACDKYMKRDAARGAE